MVKNNPWLHWAAELQSIAQAGLYYGKDVFDHERYERVREIASLMVAEMTEQPVEEIWQLFCQDMGYQTPKLDTRAAIFKEDKILLVQENDGTWALPGGWVEYNLSVKENVIKEVKEEAGLNVKATKIIAIQDRSKHNSPEYIYGVCKVFVDCELIDGHFEKNSETIASDYFSIDQLPPLAEQKVNAEQIKMCFDAHFANNWEVYFD
ncbi:MAG TPA: NUDIX hydrolase [Enterococcus columbae]|nr:NUDIX hydrolase [Enterococcus columbae]